MAQIRELKPNLHVRGSTEAQQKFYFPRLILYFSFFPYFTVFALRDIVLPFSRFCLRSATSSLCKQQGFMRVTKCCN